jgi:hypothetical protein
MNFGDSFVIKQHPKPPKNSLQHDEEYCCDNQTTNRGRLIRLPDGNCQNERYDANRSTKKSVAML